jgi:hypothetical protein
MSPEMQRSRALESAREQKAKLTKIRKGLRDGTLTLRDVLVDPPEELHNTPIIDVLRWNRSKGTRSNVLWQMNAWAVRQQINLLMPVGRASKDTRLFAVALGSNYQRRRVA